MRKGVQDVPGAQLHYRLAGEDSGSLPVLAFENGWGASLHMWSWVQRELGCRMCSASSRSARCRRMPRTVCGSAHAVQIPDRVLGLVQADPAIEQADRVVDAVLAAVPAITAVASVPARTLIPDPLFSPATRDLPEPDGGELRRRSFRSATSLRAACTELALLPNLREIAAQPAAQPRLVISADRAVEPTNAIVRRLVPAGRARAVADRAAALNRVTAQRGTGSRWEQLPHTHGGLVFSRSGAVNTSARILEFVRTAAAT
jgi:pimeloyl-ACP methyl ester carboxylesterase